MCIHHILGETPKGCHLWVQQCEGPAGDAPGQRASLLPPANKFPLRRDEELMAGGHANRQPAMSLWWCTRDAEDFRLR